MMGRPTAVHQCVLAAGAIPREPEVLRDIVRDSPSGASRVLTKTLEAAESLATLADRGGVVPEVGDEGVRELFVFRYRLLYRVQDDQWPTGISCNPAVRRSTLHAWPTVSDELASRAVGWAAAQNRKAC